MYSSTFRFLGTVGLLCALTACNTNGSSAIPTSPNSSTTIITVDGASGSPLIGVLVTLSTGFSNHAPTGVISKQKTDAAGQVTFFNLPISGELCVSAVQNSITAFYCTTPFPGTFTLTFQGATGAPVSYLTSVAPK
jgi:hypothetical protein